MSLRTAEERRTPIVILEMALWLSVTLTCLIFVCPAFGQRAPGFSIPLCRLSYTVVAGEALGELADAYFADQRYAPAILLATNARAGATAFRFIDDPGSLPLGTVLCIPELVEAEQLRLRNETYLRAVQEMVLPERWERAKSLIEIDPNHPVRVVTWVRSDQVRGYEIGRVQKASSDIWVTVVPSVKAFCQAFEKTHSPNIELLTLRLEQHLGLPPVSNKAAFVEITIRNPSDIRTLFRPCRDPSTASADCGIGPPPTSVNEQYRNWFFRQYYLSYAVAQPNQFPWTTLGYTFDWAIESEGMKHGDFVRFGESEFVIPQGARIEVQSVTATADYCASQ